MRTFSPRGPYSCSATLQAAIDQMDAFIGGTRQLNWKVVQRGFWVHGVNDLRAYLASTELFTMRGRAHLIQCPTLITQAENDPLAAGAGAFFEALQCRMTLMRFRAAEGAGGHCEMGNCSLVDGRALDWLDEQFESRRESGARSQNAIGCGSVRRICISMPTSCSIISLALRVFTRTSHLAFSAA